MRQTKRVLFCFSGHMYKAVEDYLNAQAAKGWELEKVTFFDLAKSRRAGEEAPRKYCVDLLPYHRRRAAKERDEDYLDLCEEAGWTLMARRGSVGVFTSQPGADPAPIQTDREVERYRYRRVCRNGAFWAALSLLPALLLVIMVTVLVQLVAGVDVAQAVYRYLLTWPRNWLLGTLGVTAPLFALLGLWRLGELAWSWARTRRDGAIPTPAPWALWANAIVNLLFLLAVLVLLAGVLAEGAQTGETTAVTTFLAAGAVLLFRGRRVREAGWWTASGPCPGAAALSAGGSGGSWCRPGRWPWPSAPSPWCCRWRSEGAPSTSGGTTGSSSPCIIPRSAACPWCGSRTWGWSRRAPIP